MSDQTPSKAFGEYKITVCAPADLTKDDLAECVALVETGGAVRLGSASNGIPAAQALAVCRWQGQIVGVAAIKEVRRGYASQIASRSGVSFPAETPELGYIDIDPEHRGKHLARPLVDALVSQHRGCLFATTSDERMIAVLARMGFEQRGHAWEGIRDQLLLWWRAGEESSEAANEQRA